MEDKKYSLIKALTKKKREKKKGQKIDFDKNKMKAFRKAFRRDK